MYLFNRVLYVAESILPFHIISGKNGRYVNLRYVIVYVVHVSYVTLSFITLCNMFFSAFFIPFLFDGKDLDGNLI